MLFLKKLFTKKNNNSENNFEIKLIHDKIDELNQTLDKIKMKEAYNKQYILYEYKNLSNFYFDLSNHKKHLNKDQKQKLKIVKKMLYTYAKLNNLESCLLGTQTNHHLNETNSKTDDILNNQNQTCMIMLAT